MHSPPNPFIYGINYALVSSEFRKSVPSAKILRNAPVVEQIWLITWYSEREHMPSIIEVLSIRGCLKGKDLL